jgi:tetratricopeptide (TPR) repeat protein
VTTTLPLPASDPVSSTIPDPRTIGRYRILDILGEGGMGVVYLAEQDQPHRRVALKVVRSDHASSTIARRFERESEVLGRLQHPGIAQIYEAGTEVRGDAVIPYFAMELVVGVPITEYAHAHCPTTRERLALFAKVCDAVDYAHQRGVIHRDLKPANILVDATGQPKILDFGIARITDADVQATQQTSVGEIVGTLQYMSPEQVSADPLEIDTRTDVYALGVMFYELASNRLPYDLSRRVMHDAMRVILLEDPAPLGSVDRHLRGDVETIASKALDKDKTRRYGSARELATDIRRYLANEPILARAPSAAYQLRKFAHRNRALVAGVTAAVLALAAGTVVSTVLALRARRAERLAVAHQAQAEEQTARARAVSAFLEDMLQSADPGVAQGRTLTVHDVVDQAARRANTSVLARAPTVRADVAFTIGSVYTSLGDYGTALGFLDTARALYQRTPGVDPAQIAQVDLEIGMTREGQGDLKGSLDELQHAYAFDLERLPPDADETVVTEGRLAYSVYAAGQEDSAVRLLRDALVRARRHHPEPDSVVADALLRLGEILDYTDVPVAAESLSRQAADIIGRTEGRYHPDAIRALRDQAHALNRMHRDGEAEVISRRVLDLTRTVYGDDAVDAANAYERLGQVLADENKPAEAEPLLRKALAIRIERLGPQHHDVQLVRTTLARLLQDEHRYDEAQQLFEQALTVRRAQFGPNHPAVASSIDDLGDLAEARGALSQAERDYRAALAIWHAAHIATEELAEQNSIGMVLLKEGDLEEARAMLSEVLAAQRTMYGDTANRVIGTLGRLATIATRQNHPGTADSLQHVADSLRHIGALSRPTGNP